MEDAGAGTGLSELAGLVGVWDFEEVAGFLGVAALLVWLEIAAPVIDLGVNFAATVVAGDEAMGCEFVKSC